MTEPEYRTYRTRDQIADALGGGALADIFIPLWNAIGQDEAEQLQTWTNGPTTQSPRTMPRSSPRKATPRQLPH